MADRRRTPAGGPSPLRPGPPRAETPLPASFGLAPDPSTQSFDDGTVVLGGSPLRLLRLSARARDLVDRWTSGRTLGARRPAQLLARRLVSTGAFTPRPTVTTFGRRDVTVVVPVRDRATSLERLLGALDDLACVVVDDASRDAVATKDVAERHGARFVGLPVNLGPAGARNEGLAQVQSALVAFIDSDCVPTPGWLEPLLGHLEDPVVAAVAPRIAADPPGRLHRGGLLRSSLDRGARAALVRRGSPVSFVPSAAIVVRSDVAAGPDLFDPALRGGEDVDLVWRLDEAGWDVRYVPESLVEHKGPPTVAAFLIRRAFYGTTAAPLSRRHPGALAPAEVSAWSLAVWLLAAARRPVSALAVLAASIGILARRLTGLVRDPVAVATEIAGRGTARAALPTLGGLARAWSPALVCGLLFRRTRRAAALALVLPALAEWRAARDAVDPLRFTALHIADDLAYGAGVWVGCGRERTLEPLVPRVSWRARTWSARTLHHDLEPPRGEGQPPLA